MWWFLYLTPKQALARGKLTEAEFAYIRENGAEDEDATNGGSLRGLGHLLRRRKTWGLALGYASYTYAYYVLLTWLPGYLEKQFGVKLLAGGVYTMIPWLVAVAAQFLIAGVVMDRLIARSGDETKVRRIVLVVSMLVSLSVAGAAYADSVAVALVFLSIGAAGLAVSVPAGASIVALIAPEGFTGSLGGIVNFVANLLGIAAPIVTGAVVDVTGSFAGAFLVTGVVLVAGILCYTLVLGRIEQMPAPHAEGSRMTHVAVAQFAPGDDKGANLAEVTRLAARRSRAAPGWWCCPSTPCSPCPRWTGGSSNPPSRWTASGSPGCARLAPRPGILIAGGSTRRLGSARISNTLVAAGQDGSIAALYRKIHLYDAFGFRESDFVAPARSRRQRRSRSTTSASACRPATTCASPR